MEIKAPNSRLFLTFINFGQESSVHTFLLDNQEQSSRHLPLEKARVSMSKLLFFLGSKNQNSDIP